MRTLKDLTKNKVELSCGCEYTKEYNLYQIDKEELREEAIKWIKTLRENDQTTNTYWELKNKDLEPKEFMIDWIKTFFDIEDEEIK